MKKYSDLEYLRLSKWQKFTYTLTCMIFAIPENIAKFFEFLASCIKKGLQGVRNEFVDIYLTFKEGDIKTKLSFVIMGFGSIARGQVLRGLLLLLFEVVFIVCMMFGGGGHVRAAGCSIHLPLNEAKEKLINEVRNHLK